MSENSVYWLQTVKDARELVAASKGVPYAFVGLNRAKAIVEVDEELRALREFHDGVIAKEHRENERIIQTNDQYR